MDIKVPPLGEAADSGVVATVLVKVGDRIAVNDPIVELESEKAVATIPATAGGTVAHVYVKPGDTVKVGTPLIAVAAEGAPAQPTPAAPAHTAEPPTTAPAPTAAPIPAMAATTLAPTIPGVPPPASPSLRKLARELGLDLTQIAGSGPGGRIELADVRAYIQRLQQIAAAAASAPPAAPPATAAAERVDFAKWGPVTRKPLTPLRKVIAQRMRASWTAVARVTQFDEADLTTISTLRKKYLPAYERAGVRLTVTPLILKAVVGVLQRHPIFNASLDEEAGEVVFKDYFHIGMAVDTEQGLIVPVLRDVDKKSVLDLARELEALAARTRERKVSAEEMKGGTFTISNQGGIGSGAFTPIVNWPEAAILGLGRAMQKPVVRDGQVVVRLMVPLALSYDHRLIDGAQAARFMVDLVAALENFAETEVQL